MAEPAAAAPVYEGRDLEALAELPNYYAWILARFRPYVRGHGVELGAGIGTVSALLRPHLARLDLIEPSVNLVARLRERFAGDPDVAIEAGTVEDCLPRIPDGSHDTAVMVNVLEHIADDEAALAGLARILRPGGHLLLFVPALGWLFSAMDRLHGHHRRYHLGPLRAGVEAAGFRVVDARYFDLLGVAPWWLLNTVGGATRFDPRMTGLYDRIGVPLTRAVERLAPPPVGKNVVVVACKP